MWSSQVIFDFLSYWSSYFTCITFVIVFSFIDCFKIILIRRCLSNLEMMSFKLLWKLIESTLFLLIHLMKFVFIFSNIIKLITCPKSKMWLSQSKLNWSNLISVTLGCITNSTFISTLSIFKFSFFFITYLEVNLGYIFA